MKNKKIEVIALDLEGTLISNAISQIPRPHLFTFLVGCREVAHRIVMFTTVSESRFRDIGKLLVAEDSAPKWFSTMEYINWTGNKKDLNFIPHANKTDDIILVDDVETYVADGQHKNWVEIEQFSSPYPDSDSKLLDILEIIQSRNSNSANN